MAGVQGSDLLHDFLHPCLRWLAGLRVGSLVVVVVVVWPRHWSIVSVRLEPRVMVVVVVVVVVIVVSGLILIVHWSMISRMSPGVSLLFMPKRNKKKKVMVNKYILPAKHPQINKLVLK